MALVDKLLTVITAIGADIKSLTTSLNSKLSKSSNLSDLANAATARSNLGLGNVDNVSASSLRARSSHTGTQAISTVTGLQAALDGKALQAHTHTVANVNGLQAALDGKQASLPSGTTSQFLRGDKTFVAISKSTVGLGSVDNVSAANLRDRSTHTGSQAISTVTGLQSALDGKQATLPSGTTAQFLRGDKTFTAITKANVGLGSVDNVSAANLRDRSTHTGSQAISTITGLQAALDAPITDARLKENERIWHLINDVVSVKMFGAKGDGVTDDTTAISNAINFASGRRVLFPTGTYRVTSQIDVVADHVWLDGAGEGNAVLELDSNVATLLKVGGPLLEHSRNNVRVSGFSFRKPGNGLSTAGSAVLVENSHNIRLDHIRIDPGFHTGVTFIGGQYQFLYYLANFEIAGCVNDGILLDGYCQDIWLRTGIIAGCGEAGLRTRHVSGVYADSIDMLDCTHSIHIGPQNGEESRLMWFNQVIADSSKDHGWLINPASGGKVMGLNLSNCWGASTVSVNGTGFHTTGAGTIDGVNLTNFRAMSNRGHAIVLDNGRGIDFVNPHVSRNGLGQTNNYSGFVIGPGVEHWSIIGGLSGKHGTWEAATQKHGIVFNPGAQDSFRIIGVNLEGNVTNGINNKASGGHIAHCPGFVTDRTGGATVEKDMTFVTVTHGLGFVPVLEEITAWPLVNIRDSYITHWWISDINTTSFRLNVSGSWPSTPGPTATTWWGWKYQRAARGLGL